MVGWKGQEGDVLAGWEDEVRIHDRQPTFLARAQEPQNRVLAVELLTEASCELLPRKASSHGLPIEGEEGEATVGQEGGQVKGSFSPDPSHELLRFLERTRVCLRCATSLKGGQKALLQGLSPNGEVRASTSAILGHVGEHNSRVLMMGKERGGLGVGCQIDVAKGEHNGLCAVRDQQHSFHQHQGAILVHCESLSRGAGLHSNIQVSWGFLTLGSGDLDLL